MITPLTFLTVVLGDEWASRYFSAVRKTAISTAGTITSAALAIAGVLTAIYLVKLYYDMASDEKNGGFGGVPLWDVLRPVFLMIIISSSSLILGTIDGFTNSLSSALVSSINRGQEFVIKKEKELTDDAKNELKGKYNSRYKKARADAEAALNINRKDIESKLSDIMKTAGVEDTYKITTRLEKTGEIVSGRNAAGYYSYAKTTPVYDTTLVTNTAKMRRKLVTGGIFGTSYARELDEDTRDALWESYEALIKDLELLDVETRKNIRASNKKERFLRRFGVLSIGDLVVEFFELLFNIVFNITMVFADVLLCLLAIFFPLVVAFSIVPSWKGSLMQWFGKYIEISMWKPVAAGICYIIGTAQSAVRIGAIKSLDGAQSAAASFSGSQFGVAIASLLIVYAGIKCFWKVPSIATTIFGLGGGALSDFGSMAGAAAMAGAQALGKGAKAAAAPATSMAGGAVAGKLAGVGAGTGAMTGLGNLVGKMTGMGHYSGKGFSGAMNQIFNGGNEISGTDNSKKGGGGGSSTSTRSAVGGSADASGMEEMFGPSNPSIPEADENEGSFVD